MARLIRSSRHFIERAVEGPTQSRCVESAPSDLNTVPCETLDPGVPLDKAGFTSGDWHQKFEPLWQVSEQAAQTQLQRLDDGLSDYKKGRDQSAMCRCCLHICATKYLSQSGA